MPRGRKPGTVKQSNGGGATITLGAQVAAPAQLTREQELEAEVAKLRAQVAAKPSRATEDYPEPTTTRQVADAILAIPNSAEWKPLPGADFIRNMHNIMVERVPNTVTNDKPYGEGRLITNQKGDKMYMLRGTFGAYGSAEEREARNWYIKLGQLARQLYGDPQQFRKPKPCSEDQINGILRPGVDFLQEHGLLNVNQ